MEINEIYYGFKLLNIKEIKEIDSVLYEFKHEKSGASMVYLANDDTNKCFSIGFKTLPEDSTGVCHIIEHSVLCGSKKYPVKEPFVNLLKGSMASFLNAMTASDCTIYPVASQNDKDFDNLMSVYLDAVFAPLSITDPKPFLQEGWHLEMLDEDSIKEINSCYLMLVQYYNWNSDPISIGAKGFVKFKEVRAGIDKWWDGDKHIHYKYDDCVFYKFVPLTDKISHEIIL
jgi:hypothetical protein